LTCTRCAESAPIREGIPRFVSPSPASRRPEYAGAKTFGEVWSTPQSGLGDGEIRPHLAEWLSPLEPGDVAGKTLVDLGCAWGELPALFAGWDARAVIGLEQSHAIDAGAPLLRKYPNLTLIQSDLRSPPLARGAFDLVSAMGVLHHLREPDAGMRVASSLASETGGKIYIWVYSRHGKTRHIRALEALHALFSGWPVARTRRWVGRPSGAVLHLLAKGLRRSRLPRSLVHRSPALEYLELAGRRSAPELERMILDLLVSPRANFISREELCGWGDRAGVRLHTLQHGRGMSWHALFLRGSPHESSRSSSPTSHAAAATGRCDP